MVLVGFRKKYVPIGCQFMDGPMRKLCVLFLFDCNLVLFKIKLSFLIRFLASAAIHINIWNPQRVAWKRLSRVLSAIVPGIQLNTGNFIDISDRVSIFRFRENSVIEILVTIRVSVAITLEVKLTLQSPQLHLMTSFDTDQHQQFIRLKNKMPLISEMESKLQEGYFYSSEPPGISLNSFSFWHRVTNRRPWKLPYKIGSMDNNLGQPRRSVMDHEAWGLLEVPQEENEDGSYD